MINFRFKNVSCKPIGLDIGSSSIKMIQLSVNDGNISVHAAEKIQVPPDVNLDEDKRRDFVISSIQHILNQGKFYGNKVVSNLPCDKLKITSVRLASVEHDQEQIEDALKKEASHRFGMDVDKDMINYLEVGEVRQGGETKSEFILFAADDQTIKDHIEMLESANLAPVSIDAVPCALVRSFARQLQRQEDKERTVVFVDVGSEFSTVVFARGEDISFIKQIPIGAEKFNNSIAVKLGISDEQAGSLRQTLRLEKSAQLAVACGAAAQGSSQSSGSGDLDGLSSIDSSTRQTIVDAIGSVADELAREISLCYRYYTVTFRGQRVERAVFTGGGAYENILLDALSRQLTVDVEVAQPLRGFDMTEVNFDSDRRGLLCEWAIAVGLALR